MDRDVPEQRSGDRQTPRLCRGENEAVPMALRLRMEARVVRSHRTLHFRTLLRLG